MKNKWLCFVVVLIGVLSCGVTFGESPALPSGEYLFDSIRKSRQAIRSGQVRVKTSVTEGNVTKPDWQWTISFDDPKKRADILRNGYTDTSCYDCYGNTTRMFYSTMPTPSGRKFALTFTDGFDKEQGVDYIPEPRWFGFIPMDLSNTQHFSPALMYNTADQSQKKLLTVVADIRLNKPCWRVNYVVDSIDHYIWLDQSNINRVVCVEGHFKSGDILFVDQVVPEGDLFGDQKIWFPGKLHYKRTENNIVTRSSEEVIEVISLNESLPADTFSPKTIVKPDTPVAWHLDRDRPFPEGELVWDGEKIVVVDHFSKMMKETPRIGIANIVLMLLGLVLIFFGLGLRLIKRYRQQNLKL
ncbi:MAG: hypothetical protein LBQ66_00670 [Planctomycetaceae bacterium]|nr:hypothetical protein [Planctomycetaceae bacterium]